MARDIKYAEWSDKYNVGVKIIDQQHKHFVGIMNKLFEALQSDKKDAVSNIIDELADYTDVHFATEEEYFRKFNYKEAEKHMEMHYKIRVKIIKFLSRKDQDPFKVGYDLLDLLDDWLFEHIAVMDHKYVELFHKNGLK